MRKKIIKSLIAATLFVSIMGMTVFADEVSDLKDQQSQGEQKLKNLEDQLSYVLIQLDDLELKMSQKSQEIEQANQDLLAAQEKLKSQYQDMKLRIKYMYEDQSLSISEVILTSENMGEVLNKTEYIQQVYDYDRNKLDEMSVTAKNIEDIKSQLEEDNRQLESYAQELTSKQALLYSTIEEQKQTNKDIDDQLKKATERAAQEAARRSAASSNSSARLRFFFMADPPFPGAQ